MKAKDFQQEDETREVVKEWRPHVVVNDDVVENIPDEIPLELAEGFLTEDVKPRFDMDADETMLMWKFRRMLHGDDYKRIFEKRNVGEV